MVIVARVARTAHDQSHGNRLRVPEFGVLSLRIETPAGTKSKVYLPPDSPYAEQNPPPDDGEDDVCFAPEQETVKIQYTLSNPGAITAARLELYGPWEATPLWTRDLTPEECTDGEHEIEWTGEVTRSEHFPDEHITAACSPYKLKLVVSGGVQGDPPCAWTYFHVLVADLELELGERLVLSRSRDRRLYDRIKDRGLPVDDDKLELRLPSNIFSTAPAEMHNRTDYLQYEQAWGKGPQVPIFCKVFIRDSNGESVEAPKALGRTKFLWDWESVDENTSRHHAKARAFLNAALDYDKNRTRPKGDNCHKDRGGKRGPGADATFIATSGYAPADAPTQHRFPFKVERGKHRRWAATSEGWGSGHFAGKTGVLLQPSRMAGDAVRVSVQVAYERLENGDLVLDVRDDPPLRAAVQKKTGIFEVWRQIDFVKYTKKKAALPDFGVPTFRAYYEKAYIRMRYVAGRAATMPAADYNTRFTNHINGQPGYVQAAIDPAVDQHATGNVAATFRTFAQWRTAFQAAQGWTNAQMTAWLAGAGSNINTASKYHSFCGGWATTIVKEVCDAYLSPTDGVNLLHFQGLHNRESAPGGQRLNGFATSFPSTGRNKCAFVLCAAATNYGGNSNTPEQTVTHEIGHCMFLAHAPQNVTATDIANQPDATVHDDDWTNCAMGYRYDQERKFCGFCLLRLRGWDRAQLKPTAADNRKR